MAGGLEDQQGGDREGGIQAGPELGHLLLQMG